MTPDQATLASDVASDVAPDAASQGDMEVRGDMQVQVEEILVEEVSIDGLCGVY
jgi:mycofactocin precursor